jgi:hypothetical protein
MSHLTSTSSATTAKRSICWREINKIQEIIEENQQHLLDSWHESFIG